MSDWDHFGWYKPPPKRPPPKRGIRVKRAGTTWWGQRWIEALERMSRGYSNRLARGRTYARAGRVHDLVVKTGEVTARVTGSRATPYKVHITLSQISDKRWKKAIAAMAGKAQFAADLLAGEMPLEIDAVFKEAGASLFPVRETDLETACSCPDWANPCKHVAATHYVLGEALDRDPFLLFELRGRTRKQVLDALRVARGSEGMADSRKSRARAVAKARTQAVDAEIPRVSLANMEAAEYDNPREPLPAPHSSFATPSIPGAVLRQLGTPPGWSSEASPADMLGPMIRAAAEAARRIALADPDINGEDEVDALTKTPVENAEPRPEARAGRTTAVAVRKPDKLRRRAPKPKEKSRKRSSASRSKRKPRAERPE